MWATWAEREPPRTAADHWDYPPLSLVGRLKPGVNMASALAQLQPLVPRLRENYPRQWREKSQFHLFELPRMTTDYMENEVSGAPIVSVFLMSISAVVLLIACLNLANMIVVQGTTRHREIAIRMAIGGGRLRIIRHLLFEFGLLALLGGAFGLILAFWGNRVLNAWVDVPHLGVDLAGAFSMSLDLRVLGATLGFCVLATVLFGLRPALHLSRRDIIRGISNFEFRNPNVRKARLRLPRGLSVVTQIALSVVLVVGAALFTRSALHAARLNPGFSLDDKLIVQIDPLSAGYDRARGIQLYETLAERLRSMPGVQAVTLSTSFPFGGGGDPGQTIKECVPGEEDKEPEAPARFSRSIGYLSHGIGPDFFESVGIPLLQGRSFEPLDSARARAGHDHRRAAGPPAAAERHRPRLPHQVRHARILKHVIALPGGRRCAGRARAARKTEQTSRKSTCPFAMTNYPRTSSCASRRANPRQPCWTGFPP